MKRKNGEILYVGKAKSLRSRVCSYFNQSAKSSKTEILVSHIYDFDFLMTETDAEAFVLENNLIKKHAPKYNIRMRDDKSYPYIVVDWNEPFPRLSYTRRVKRKKGIEVFGPFTQGSRISEVLRILEKSFQLRDCTLREFRQRKRPCLLYQMSQCSAPCVGYISQEDYDKDLELALDLFKGNGRETLNSLRERMANYAEKEEFERAAMMRDFIETLQTFLEETRQQRNVEFEREDQNLDVVAYNVGDIELDLAFYIVRKGILMGHKNFHFAPTETDEETVQDEISSFLLQYYTSGHDTLPTKIIIDLKEEKKELLGKAFEQLQEDLKQKIKVQKSKRKYKSLHKLTYDHAVESQRVRQTRQDSVYTGLNKLKDLLGLKEFPRELECYDVAIWQGASPAASQVVFREGKPDKQRYRYYHLETRAEQNNDYAMLKEFVARRLKSGHLPDVMIVDGGKGQVSSLLAVLKEENIDVPVVGIAKARSGQGETFSSQKVSQSQERLIIPGRANPYVLNKNPALFRIIVQMRDEAHRFSRKLHHKSEKKRTFASWLDEIPGIGPKTKEKVLKNLSVPAEKLAEYQTEEICEMLGVQRQQAQKIREYWTGE